MSNNKTDKEIPLDVQFAIQKECDLHYLRHERQAVTEGAEFGYSLASSRLATLQAENEKLWKLLEEQYRHAYWLESDHHIEESEYVNAWAAFQKANGLTQNKK